MADGNAKAITAFVAALDVGTIPGLRAVLAAVPAITDLNALARVLFAAGSTPHRWQRFLGEPPSEFGEHDRTASLAVMSGVIDVFRRAAHASGRAEPALNIEHYVWYNNVTGGLGPPPFSVAHKANPLVFRALLQLTPRHDADATVLATAAAPIPVSTTRPLVLPADNSAWFDSSNGWHFALNDYTNDLDTLRCILCHSPSLGVPKMTGKAVNCSVVACAFSARIHWRIAQLLLELRWHDTDLSLPFPRLRVMSDGEVVTTQCRPVEALYDPAIVRELWNSPIPGAVPDDGRTEQHLRVLRASWEIALARLRGLHHDVEQATEQSAGLPPVLSAIVRSYCLFDVPDGLSADGVD